MLLRQIQVHGQLSWRQSARIYHVTSILLQFLRPAIQWRSRQSHQACASRFQDAKGRDELHESIYTRRFRRAAINVNGYSAGKGSRWNSHFNNTIISAYIQHLPAKLMRQMRNSIQMLILMS